MKKSKEQLISELGLTGYSSHMTGYWFSTSKDHKEKFYWSSYHALSVLKICLTPHETIFGWRRTQTDWRPVNELVIYDRFGSKLTWSEHPERSFEIKLSDAGKEFEEYGDDLMSEGTWEKIRRLYKLFPVKEKI